MPLLAQSLQQLHLMLNKGYEMLNKFIKNKSGFTLIEMIVAVAVTVIVIGTLTSMVMYAYKSYHKADATSTVLNGINSITEAVRELTFNATEAEISNVTAPPTVEVGYTSIYCIDGSVYVDGNVIQSAKGIGTATLEISFEADNSGTNGKVVKYKITADKENGEQAIQPQELTAYLNNCMGDILGGTGNCIKVKKTVEGTT